jgi:regulator of sigma E protease
MGVLGTVLAFIVVLVVLVLVHEVGHFVMARLAGVTVQEFGIGYPPRITSVVWRGTRYSLNWIPLGGFVKMLGEDGEIEAERMREQGLSEAAVDRAMRGSFNRRPVIVRLVVLVAGVAMNFLLAIALFAAAFMLPTPAYVGPLTVTALQPNSPAAEYLQVGDQILGANGRTFHLSTDLTKYVTSQAGQPVTLSIKRAGTTEQITLTPRVLTSAQVSQGLSPVGFSWTASQEDQAPLAGGPFSAIALGATQTWQLAIQIPGALWQTVLGLVGLGPVMRDAAGPIGIAEMTGQMLTQPLIYQLSFVALLSVNLGVLNILPFPPLDGGRVLVVLIEAVRRKRLPAEREALIYLTGFLVLMALVILISIQDIGRVAGS